MSQLDLLAPPVERITVEPTPEVVYRGANAKCVPVHQHVPTPRPRSLLSDDEWLAVLAEAERLVRWKRWTQPHPLPLDDRPHDCVGGDSRRWYDSKGISIDSGARVVTWPTILRGLRAQREAEPHIADARDLAHAYSAVEQYDRFYVRDGGSVQPGDDDWRERVALPHLAKLKQIVLDLATPQEATA